MISEKPEVVGIIPAAGNASRISPIPCSKEILPVGFQEEAFKEGPKIKVAASYLLESLSEAGSDKIYMIIQKEKCDIPKYFGMGMQADYSLAYIVSEPTPGTHFTIDLAYRFVKDRMILLGFPDIIFKPRDAFVSLLDKQKQTGAEVVLGLFKTTKPQNADMVDVDDQGRIKKIVVKPRKTKLEYTWTIAVWTPVFSEYLHKFVAKTGNGESSKSEQAKREIFIGDVIQDALQNGLKIEAVLFPDGEFIDIGTVPDLKKVINTDL